MTNLPTLEELTLVHEVESVNFLRVGDRIRVTGYIGPPNERTHEGYATVDMNGHCVSDDFGCRQGNTYYEDPKKAYINVRFDGVEYGLFRNKSLYQRTNGQMIYVDAATWLRIESDMAEHDGRNEKEARREVLKDQIVQGLKDVQVILDRIEPLVDEYTELSE